MDHSKACLNTSKDEIKAPSAKNPIKKRAKSWLHNSKAQADNDDQHSCERSLSTGDDLCRQNQPFCGLARVVNVLELCQKHCLLHHTQEDHTSNPELNPEDVSPVECTNNQPAKPQHNIHPTHRSIERKERPVSDREKASSGSSHLDVNTCFHRLSVADGSHMDNQQVDSLLLQLIHRLVVGPHRTRLSLRPECN